MKCLTCWRSTRAPPRRAPSLFDAGADDRRRGAAGIRPASIRPRAGSSTTPRRSGARRSRPAREALAKAGARARRGRRPSASPTSARRRWSGTARPASRSTTPSSGRTGAPPSSAQQLRAEGHEPLGRRRAPACCSTPISRRPRSPGCSTTCRARARAPSAASSPSARSTRFLLWRLTGGAVHATDATNAARTLLFDIRTRRSGTTSCWRCSACRARCCREVRDCAGDFGVARRRAFRRADRDPRHRRRPAGGDRSARPASRRA